MQTTMNLLQRALAIEPAPYGHKKLGLSCNALNSAKQRGNLSPAIAGEIASELGENYERWVMIAAAESERNSACKERMHKRLRLAAKS